ncbi:MAG: hypothetical protein HRT61_18680 [Ekhidna sp.]|nr:hypothetical protein [Ekhidna sp.]
MKTKLILVTCILLLNMQSVKACVSPSISGPAAIWVNAPDGAAISGVEIDPSYTITNPEASYGAGTPYYVVWAFNLIPIEFGENGVSVTYDNGLNTAQSGQAEQVEWELTANINYTQGVGGPVWNTWILQRDITVVRWDLRVGGARLPSENELEANTKTLEKDRNDNFPKVLKVQDMQGNIIWKYSGTEFKIGDLEQGHYVISYKQNGSKLRKEQIYIAQQ